MVATSQWVNIHVLAKEGPSEVFCIVNNTTFFKRKLCKSHVFGILNVRDKESGNKSKS